MGLLSRIVRGAVGAARQGSRSRADDAAAMLKQLGRPFDINDLQDVQAQVGPLGAEDVARLRQMIDAGELQMSQGPVAMGRQTGGGLPATQSPFAPRDSVSPFSPRGY